MKTSAIREKSLREEVAAGRLTQAECDKLLNDPTAAMWDDISVVEQNASHESRSRRYSSLQNTRRCLQDNADGLLRTMDQDASLKESLQKNVLEVNVMDALSLMLKPSPEMVAHLPKMIEQEKKLAQTFHQIAETTESKDEMQARMFKAAKHARLTADYMEKMVAIRRAQGIWPK